MTSACSKSVALEKVGEKNYELAWGVHSGGAMVAAWSINLQAAHFASGEMEEAIRLIAPIIREASSQDRHAVRAQLFPDYLLD